MKNFCVLTVAATAALSSTVAHAGYGFVSDYWRVGTTNGLGGVIINQIGWSSTDANFPSITATAPSGLNSWAEAGSGSIRWAYGPGHSNGTTLSAESYDVAAASAWQNGGRGVWSFNNGGNTLTVDTTPYWNLVENRVLPELDAASSQLYLDILASGSTGTFTFNLKQAAVWFSRWTLASPTYGAGTSFGQINAGETSFSITIAEALPSNFWLRMSTFSTNSIDNTHLIGLVQGVAYGTDISVPAPGALALLGLAGFAGRRRR